MTVKTIEKKERPLGTGEEIAHSLQEREAVTEVSQETEVTLKER